MTVVTQVGGLIYILSLSIVRLGFPASKRTRKSRWLTFGGFYLLATFVVVPLLAPLNGRHALPIWGKSLKPQNLFTVLANRHYTSTKMNTSIREVSESFHLWKSEGPPRVVRYLDANFPFIDGFPLLPHLSHNDGNKLDLAFRYSDHNTHLLSNGTPSLFGYGVYEGPEVGEVDQTAMCKEKNGLYDVTKYLGIRKNRSLQFDEVETKKLLKLLIEANTQKIFIEPHLKNRLGLTSDKVRFHGCHAVRHDDHIHIQVQ